MRLPLSICPPNFFFAPPRPAVRRFEIENLEERTLLAANLQLVDFVAPSAASVGSGRPFQIQWTVQNTGDAATDAPFWFDSVYLSDDDVFDPFEDLLQFWVVVEGAEPLGPSETYTFTVDWTVPNTDFGNRYLLFVIDDENNLLEDDDNDNVLAVPIELSAPDVDLTVSSFTSPVSTVLAGQPFLLNWIVSNSGSDFATAPRTDRLTLSTDDFLDLDDEILFEHVRSDGVAPFGDVEGSVFAALPLGLAPGVYYLFFETDVLNDQYETHDFNNGVVLPIEVVEAGPDLVIESVEADDVWTPGELVHVFYTLSNQGSLETPDSSWVGFYLSTDDVLDSDDLLVHEESSEEAAIETSFFFEGGLYGDLYLLVVADHRFEISEEDESNNVVAVPVFVEPPPFLDVAVSDFAGPATAVLGQSIQVSYVVANNGFAAIDAEWIDRFYLSDDDVLDEFDLLVDPTDFVFSEVLGPNESRLVERTVQIANAVVGDGKYLIVQVGVGLADDAPENNVAAIPIDVVAGDLEATSLEAPTSVSVNQRIDVSWTVTNVGGAPFSGTWQDRLYLSSDAVLSAFDTILHIEVVNRSLVPLGPGDGYTVTPTIAGLSSIVVPDVAAGEYYLFVQTLAVGAQDVDPSNNVLMLGPISIAKPDLTVSEFSAPSVAVEGQIVSVTYTVLNDSDAPMGAEGVTDRFVLSDDAGLSADDTFLTLVFIGGDALPLPAHGSYERTVNLQLPVGVVGSKFLILRTNTFPASQGETTRDNNDFAHAIEIVEAAVDMTVSIDVSPSAAAVGSSFDVTYTVTNEGTVATLAPNWVDRIYLSPDGVQTGQLLASVDAAEFSPLGPGQSYTVTRTVSILSGTTAGSYFLRVATNNVAPQQPESNFGNNVAVAPINLFLPLPDLIVTEIAPPPDGVFSGSKALVSFTVQNVGFAPTQLPVWYDYVFLSTDSSLTYPDEGGDDESINLQPYRPIPFPNAGYLAPGDSYVQTVEIPIPLDAVGPWYVYVSPNGIGSHFPRVLVETDRTNNLARSDAFKVTLTPPPDLVVSQILAPLTGFSGALTNLSWTVANVGPGQTAASNWIDRVYLSTDDVLDAGDVLLATSGGGTSFVHAGALPSGESYFASQTLVLPNGISGQFYLLVHADAQHQVFEAGLDGNNVGARLLTINLTPPPDLVVDSVVVPPSGMAAHAVDVTYTVTNRGNTNTPATSSLDRIYLSASGQLDDDAVLLQSVWGFSGVLQVDQSYAKTVSVVLPPGLEGEFHLVVAANVNDTVFELDRANNVLAGGPVLIQSVPPNLVVTEIVAGPEVEAGKVAVVSWTVQNTGVGDAAVSQWSDAVYLSTDGAVEGARLLGRFVRTGVLNPGESYTRTAGVLVPYDVQGAAWIFVVADDLLPDGNAYGAVFEGDAEGDNASSLVPVDVLRTLANLAVVELTVPAAAQTGESIEVAWTVENSGGATFADSWMDDVYLSTDATLSANDVYLGSVFRSGALGGGESYTAQLTAAIPQTLDAGDYFILVSADRILPRSFGVDPMLQRVQEDDKADNVASSALAVSLAPVPDLRVANIEVPDAVVSGRSLSVTWTVENDGAAAAGSWYDAVYLSSDPVFNPYSDRFLGAVQRAGGLDAGGSYTVSASFDLPGGVTGPQYLIVWTDSSSSVFERGVEANNVAVHSEQVQILLGQPVDFVVGVIVVPPAATVGQSATIAYTVENLVDLPVPGGWTDAVYLSADAVWDPSDALFARVHRTEDLAQGASYTETVTAPLPILAPGNYYVVIRTDVRNQVFETNNANNVGVSLDVATVDVVELELGVPRSDALAAGAFVLYRVEVAAGQTLRFHWDSDDDSAATEMYVRFGQPPTRTIFDERSAQPFNADHEIVVPASQAGVYYVLVHAGQGVADGTILVESLPFSVTSASPGQVGNAGAVTLEIDGALFTRGTTFELVSEDAAVLQAQFIVVASQAKAYATFDLAGRPAGAYDLVARAINGSVAIAPGAVTVVDSLVGGRMATGVVVPQVTLRGALGTFFLTYSNNGDADVVAPLIIVSSPTGTYFGPTGPWRGPGEVDVHYGAVDDGPAGVLRPGQTVALSYVFQAPDVAGDPYFFEFFYYDGDDATPIDWDWFEQQLDPWVRAADDLPPVLAQLQSDVGPTMGDFVRFLSRMATLIPEEVGDRTNYLDLVSLGVEFAKAQLQTSLSGRVVSDDLTVDVSGHLLRAVEVDSGETHLTRTLNDGSFVFPSLSPGTYRFEYAAAVVPEGLTVVVSEGEHAAGLLIPLVKAGGVSGTVRTPSGAVVAEGFALLYDLEAGVTQSSALVGGKYAFQGLPPGTYTLELDAPGRAKTLVGPIVVSGPANLQIDAVMLAESVVTANVLLADGLPIASPVAISAEATIPLGLVGTSSASLLSETARLGGLAAGEYLVTIQLDGYMPFQTLLTLAVGQTLDLGDVTLVSAGSISGVVQFGVPTTPENAPVVFLLLDGETVGAMIPNLETGAFSFANLAPGFYEARVSTLPGSFGSSQFVDLSAGDHVEGLVLTTSAGGSIFGQATDSATGLPVPGVSVVIYGPSGGFGEVRTDADGQYRFDQLRLGAYTVALRIGDALSRVDVEIVDFANAEFEVNLGLQSVARLGGRLETSLGEAVGDASVLLYSGDDLIASTEVGAGGEFQFLFFRPGLYTLQAISTHGSFAPQDVVIAPGNDDSVVLSAGELSLGVMLDGDAAIVAGAQATLFALGPNGPRLAAVAVADEDGVAQFSNLVGGDYELRVFAADQSFGGAASVTLAPAGPDLIIVEMEALTTLSGVVTGPGGAPVAGAFVTLTDASTGLDAGFGFTNDDGQYRAPDLLPGVYDVVVRRSGFQSVVQVQVDVANDAVLNVQLDESGARIEGVVVDADGRPIPLANVFVFDSEGRVVGTAIASSQGAFVVTTAVGSDFRIVVQADGYSPFEVSDASVGASDVVDLGAVELEAVASPQVVESTAEVGGLRANGFAAESPSAGAAAPSAAFSTLSQSSFSAFQSNQANGHSGQTLDDDAINAILEEFQRIDLAMPDHGLGKIIRPDDPNWLAMFDIRKQEYEELLRKNRITDPGPPPKCPICVTPYQRLMQAIQEQEEFYKAYSVAMDLLGALRVTYPYVLFNEINSQIIVPFVVPFAGFAGAFLLVAGGVAQQLLNYGSFFTGMQASMTAKDWVTSASFSSSAAIAAQTGALGSLESYLRFNKYAGLSSPSQRALLAQLPTMARYLGLIGAALNFFGTAISGNLLAMSRDVATKIDELEEKIKSFSKLLREKIDATNEAYANYQKCNAHAECDDDDRPNPPPPPPAPGSGGGGGGGNAGGRIDPNDIVGPEGYADPRFIPAGQTLNYTIRFENLEEATLPVQHLAIQTQLDADLDFRTVRFGSFGWSGLTFQIATPRPLLNERIDLTDSLGFFIDVAAVVDVATGMATWTLTAVDPATGQQPADDQVGFLPPNSDSGVGEGFVTYSVRTKSSLPTGTTIDAQATIVFDTETPIDTPIWTNTLDVDAPTSYVEALPASSNEAAFLVRWSAADAPGGAGLASVAVLVSRDGGPFRTWLVAPSSQQEALFEGILGSEYRFLSISVDNAGNVETPPLTPDATTTLLAPAPFLVVEGPASALAHRLESFTVTATNASPVGEGLFLYRIDWNDDGAFDQYVSADAAVYVLEHAFAEPGLHHYRVQLLDLDLAVLAEATGAVGVLPFAAEPDPGDPEKIILTWNGAAGDDHFVFTPTHVYILKQNGQAVDVIHVLSGVLAGVVANGGAGNDVLDASQLDVPVTLIGGAGDDTLLGGSADDWIEGDGAEGGGADWIDGGGGNDRLYGDSPNPRGSSRNDTVLGGAGDDVIQVDGAEGSGVNSVDAGPGNDIVLGGKGRDVISGGDGDDLLVGGAGQDILDGGGGSDLIIADRVVNLTLDDLQLIHSEWVAARPLPVRAANILGTGEGERANGDVFLFPGVNVQKDQVVDLVLAGADEDWLLLDAQKDLAPDFEVDVDLLTIL